nr:hypothetical protein [Nocardia amamiensis]
MFVDDADVAIAEGCPIRSAAGARLLRHALQYLGSEVAGVELRNGAEDAVQQHAAGRLVDVLRRRDQFGTSGSDGHVDFDVVGPVAGKAVDLVDDDVVHWVLLDVGEHLLKLGPVGSLGALAALHELLDHDRVQRRGLPPVGLSLRG